MKGFIRLVSSLVLFAIVFLTINYANVEAGEDKEYYKLSKKELSKVNLDVKPKLSLTFGGGNLIVVPYKYNYDIIIYDYDLDQAYAIKKHKDNLITFPPNKDNLRLFVVENKNTTTGRGYGFMNNYGDIVIKPDYAMGDLMFGGVATLGTFDPDGKTITNYEIISNEGKVLSLKKYNYIDRFMIPKSYLSKNSLEDKNKYTLNYFRSDFFDDYKPTKYSYYIDEISNNKNIRDSKYNKYPNHNAVFPGKKGIIDNAGNEILPDIYEDVRIGEGDIISVSKDGKKYGYINPKGAFLLPAQYECATRFKDNKAAIVKDGQITFIDDRLKPIQAFKKANHWKELYNLGDIDALDLAYSYDSPINSSAWAREYIVLADNLKILSENLKKNYKKNITREEFCELLVEAIVRNTANENIKNKKLQEQLILKGLNEKIPFPFTDTKNKFIKIAYRTGIVKGKSATKFVPDGEITRQEAAVMLIRAYSVCHPKGKLTEFGEYSDYNLMNEFKDFNKMAKWAKIHISLAKQLGLMNGVGNKLFSPLGTYTVEQSITTIIRLYDII